MPDKIKKKQGIGAIVMRMYVGVLKKNNLEHASGLNLHANKNVTRTDKGHVAMSMDVYATLKFPVFSLRQ